MYCVCRVSLFECLWLSLAWPQRWEDPVATPEGVVFDIVNIVPYIQKHKTNPVTGLPIKLSQLIKLSFYQNADGEYHCPVLNKVRGAAAGAVGGP